MQAGAGGNVFLTQLILLNLLWFTENIYLFIKIDLPTYLEEYKGLSLLSSSLTSQRCSTEYLLSMAYHLASWNTFQLKGQLLLIT